MRAVAVFVCLAALPPVARAQDELSYDLRIDVPVIAVGSVGWIVSEALKKQLATEKCRWCDTSDDGSDSLNGVDAAVRDALVWSNTSAADVTSHVTGFVVAPAAALGLTALAASNDDRLRDWPVDALIIAESAVIALDLNQVVKFIAARERPFVHVRSPAEKAAAAGPDDNLSFFSGHTTSSFALAVSAGTVASMRRYRLAPVVWATGLTLAVGVGYLRIAADRHYFTDVVTGAIIGSSIGFVVPYVLHRGPGAARPEVVPVPGGAMAGISGTW